LKATPPENGCSPGRVWQAMQFSRPRQIFAAREWLLDTGWRPGSHSLCHAAAGLTFGAFSGLLFPT